MNPEKEEKFIAKAAKALGDKHRLMILQEIAKQGSINCTQAQQLTNLAQPSVSFHIKQLTNCELVEINKIGREVNLSINQDKMQEFLSVIGQIQPVG
jgi:ArsR family transcriptional regulator, arsenate/arsenite/antimonite-responsive transcriptional repressor